VVVPKVACSTERGALKVVSQAHNVPVPPSTTSTPSARFSTASLDFILQ
jgi:hypothetical protein